VCDVLAGPVADPGDFFNFQHTAVVYVRIKYHSITRTWDDGDRGAACVAFPLGRRSCPEKEYVLMMPYDTNAINNTRDGPSVLVIDRYPIIMSVFIVRP
jgi:hypothetical protein